MEARLIKQRNRLIRLILLILLAVWSLNLTIYCVRLLQTERVNLQSSVQADYESAFTFFSGVARDVYLDSYSLLSFKQTRELGNDVQIIAVDSRTNDVVADSSYKLMRKFSKSFDNVDYPPSNCFLDRNVFMNALDDSQMERIAGWLHTKGSDGREYKLVCSKFYIKNTEVSPSELMVVYTDDRKQYIEESDIVEIFPLNHDKITDDLNPGEYTYSQYSDNIIPEDFLFGENYGQDLISTIPEELLEQSQVEVKAGFLEYIYYSSETINLDALIYRSDKGDYVKQKKPYIFRYAKKANLIKNRFDDLIVGLAVPSVLFLSIGLVLCRMIWKSFSNQILLEKRRRDFTNSLAHDIKTPLFVISGYAYTLKENIDPDERENYIDRIIGQTDQINGMVHRMLNLSKLDSYVMTLNRSEFDLNELTEEVLNDFTVLPDGKRIEAVHSGNSLISADRELIRTVIQNLIDNAVKYSLPDNRITIDVTDQSFRIANPTEPLTKSELKKIWQPYYRQDKSRHKKGNGLGLSIVKAILDLHKADYNVSVKDGVITFLVEF